MMGNIILTILTIAMWGLCGTVLVLMLRDVSKYVKENNIPVSVPFGIVSVIMWAGLIAFLAWGINNLAVIATWNKGIMFIGLCAYIYPMLYSTFRIFLSKEEIKRKKNQNNQRR